MNNTAPIGVFDSGVGGLTVANAIRNRLPNENIIYFGDTSHLPYGDKSPETIQFYSNGITKFLLNNKCKVIVIACNSASANAYETVTKLAGSVPVINVIDPAVEYVSNQTEYRHVGVIGTKSTMESDMYAKKIHEAKKGVLVSSMATPLFVPMIEEGFIYDDISNAIVRNYLSRHEIGGIEALILGCTHYPIIKNQINKFFNFNIDVIDSSKVVAESLAKLLKESGIENDSGEQVKQLFYVSDITKSFKVISKMFFEEEVNLVKKNIWE